MTSIASLSLDLDDKWAYLKTHGDDVWSEFPSYLEFVVPRILRFLGERGLTITFFIVGKDAERLGHGSVLRQIADDGHEIGNHSFMHDPWLHLYTDDKLRADFEQSESALEAATGQRPRGFRGPGFSLSTSTLKMLRERDYAYDATVFPNLLNPLARAYFFFKSDLSKEEKQQRRALFGTWKEALKPVKPFEWELDDGRLFEIPVTTMPLFKIPIHMSYVIYLAGFSKWAALRYFESALLMCRVTRTEPSILLHPLDFLGVEDSTGLDFFPGMNQPLERKLAIVDGVLGRLCRKRRVVPVGDHVEEARSRMRLRTLPLPSSTASLDADSRVG